MAVLGAHLVTLVSWPMPRVPSRCLENRFGPLVHPTWYAHGVSSLVILDLGEVVEKLLRGQGLTGLEESQVTPMVREFVEHLGHIFNDPEAAVRFMHVPDVNMADQSPLYWLERGDRDWSVGAVIAVGQGTVA